MRRNSVFGCTVDLMVMMVTSSVVMSLDNLCLFELLKVKNLVMRAFLEFKYLQVHCSLQNRHFSVQIIDINPCEATYQNAYILSLPSFISDLNRKWYNPWLKSIGSAIKASFMVIYLLTVVQVVMNLEGL